MAVIGRIIKGLYFDSVTLMKVSGELAHERDIQDVSMVMGTSANKSILRASGMYLADFETAGDTDLIVSVRLPDPSRSEVVLDRLTADLKQSIKPARGSREVNPSGWEGSLELLKEANLALISVAGRYAGRLAHEALDHGLHVMIFSDNVPVETEKALKIRGRDMGRLVMGPDCGTAIINGVPLGFANAVNRGDIGIVAASGTGLQEIGSIVSNLGGGISQAIGTGSRDLKQSVGGIMFQEGIRALALDDRTRVIVTVSKPPDPEILVKIRQAIQAVPKPVVSFFLGAEPSPDGPSTLEETAWYALALSRNELISSVRHRVHEDEVLIGKNAEMLKSRLRDGQKYVRGLFSGGTFCVEAQIILSRATPELYSNIPAGRVKALDDPLVSRCHTVIDLGDDAFTVGRPHPMIDYSLRKKRFLAEADDPQTAVILLDIVLGFGAHRDPAAEMQEIIAEASRRLAVVCSVTGTDRDIQNRAATVHRLEQAGAVVMPSNSAACRLAAALIG